MPNEEEVVFVSLCPHITGSRAKEEAQVKENDGVFSGSQQDTVDEEEQKPWVYLLLFAAC